MCKMRISFPMNVKQANQPTSEVFLRRKYTLDLQQTVFGMAKVRTRTCIPVCMESHPHSLPENISCMKTEQYAGCFGKMFLPPFIACTPQAR